MQRGREAQLKEEEEEEEMEEVVPKEAQWHRSTAQGGGGGGGAQTWSDASCITLTLEHWEPALHQLFNHFVRLLAIWPSTLPRPV